MKKIRSKLAEIRLAGIAIRTNNAQILDGNPSDNKIAVTAQKYFSQGLSEKIKHRKRPGRTLSVFTNYESDFTGDYTYFIGKEVTSFKDLPEGFETLTIPSQFYVKFTSRPGPMPDVCIDMWQQIWKMSPSDLGGERAYIADFEVYDERSHDQKNTILDIYIGIK